MNEKKIRFDEQEYSEFVSFTTEKNQRKIREEKLVTPLCLLFDVWMYV